MRGANWFGANLRGANLDKANLERANLTGCRVFDTSFRQVKLAGAIQTDLIISDSGGPAIIVDNLEVAQLIQSHLNNERDRDEINEMTTGIVLMLGQFTPERKAILDAVWEELRGSQNRATTTP